MSEKFTHDGVEYTLPSPNGLVFESVAALHRAHVRDERPIYEGGVRVGTEKELCAEFGDMDSPVLAGAEGEEPFYAIRGHFINTLEQAKKKGWSDEERRLVEKKLLVTQNPQDYWLHTKPPAGKPWPSYDETQAGKIAEIAAATGMIAEALLYERENARRPTVIGALKKAAGEPELEPEAEELAAA